MHWDDDLWLEQADHLGCLSGIESTADGYATAFMVMGLDKARAYVENEPGLEAFFIVDGGSGTFQTYATKELEEIIKKE